MEDKALQCRFSFCFTGATNPEARGQASDESVSPCGFPSKHLRFGALK